MVENSLNFLCLFVDPRLKEKVAIPVGKENIRPAPAKYGIDNNKLAAPVPGPAVAKKVIKQDNVLNNNAIQKLLEQQKKGKILNAITGAECGVGMWLVFWR